MSLSFQHPLQSDNHIHPRVSPAPRSFGENIPPRLATDHEVYCKLATVTKQQLPNHLKKNSETYFSSASIFIPSSKTPVTFVLIYSRKGAPCLASCFGIASILDEFFAEVSSGRGGGAVGGVWLVDISGWGLEICLRGLILSRFCDSWQIRFSSYQSGWLSKMGIFWFYWRVESRRLVLDSVLRLMIGL